jgi:hypothetical protein
MKLKTIVRAPGITRPARSRRRAGPRNIASDTGRVFLPSTRPAIANKSARITKKAEIAMSTDVNLGIEVEMNSDIS